MFGPALLVSPVTDPGVSSRQVYLPVQKSYHFALGKYTWRELTPGSVTGLTSKAGPIYVWASLTGESCNRSRCQFAPSVFASPKVVPLRFRQIHLARTDTWIGYRTHQ